MLKKRLIPCLISKDGLIVQSINFRQYLPIGRVKIAIEFVAKWDVDEIILLDISATRDGKKPDFELVSLISERCFVPLTLGGGIHDISDIKNLIRAGADKIVINSESLSNPDFIRKSSVVFGSQCIVVSVDVKRHSDGRYEVYGDSGSNPTGLDPVEWAVRVQELGAGEIFLNSIDRDGSKLGYDLDLVKMITGAVKIPVIACGGVGKMEHLVEGITVGKASAVAAANIFQYIEHSTIIAKAYLLRAGIDIRLDTLAKYEDFTFDETGRILKKKDSELDEIWFERHIKEIL
jgi:cyclase